MRSLTTDPRPCVLLAVLMLWPMGCQRSPERPRPAPAATPTRAPVRGERALALADPDAFAGVLSYRPAEELGHESQVRVQLALTEGGRRVAVGHGSLLSVLEPGAGREPQRLLRHPAPIHALALSQAGTVLASLDQQGTVRLFDLTPAAAGMPRQVWPGPPPRRATELTLRPDGAVLIRAECEPGDQRACPIQHLRLYDVQSGRIIAQLEAPSGVIAAHAFAADGSLVMLPQGQAPLFFHAPTGAPMAVVGDNLDPIAAPCTRGSQPPPPYESLWALAADHRALAVIASPATLCVWDLDAHRVAHAVDLRRLLRPGSGLVAQALLGGARGALVSHAARRSGASATSLIDLQTGQVKQTLARFASATALGDGATVLATFIELDVRAGISASRLFWIGPDLSVRPLPSGNADQFQRPRPEAVRRDGRYAAFTASSGGDGEKGAAGVLELRPPGDLHELTLPASLADSTLAFAGEDQLLYADDQANVQLLQISTAAIIATTPLPSGQISDLAYHGADELAIASLDGWSASSRRAAGASPAPCRCSRRSPTSASLPSGRPPCL